MEILEDVLLLHENGLRVLAAPPRPEMADEVNADQIRTIIQFLLRRHFAYVLVDTASTMDDTTLAILDTTDLLIAILYPRHSRYQRRAASLRSTSYPGVPDTECLLRSQ